MNFQDEKISKINLNDDDSIFQIIVGDLCGERYYKQLLNADKELLSKLLAKARNEGLNYAQFNELLLLLDQDRVSEAFFEFLFGKGKRKLQELVQGIIKFRGFAMLCFGNFRFAYKQLSQKNEEERNEALKPYCVLTETVKENFRDRPIKALEIDKIKEKNKTWYTGYIAKKKYENEASFLSKLLLSTKFIAPCQLTKSELQTVADVYEKIGKDIKEVEGKALQNTDIYLTWDYMDVYIATSMRHKWEFEETFDFINEVFAKENIKDLKLRYFDPTQSQCKNRIDKGLIEGLMLKRAHCTIYMAQEVDTMGKDSELAATLAQRKPVIAYVPHIDINNHEKKISKYPLDFFKQRILILRADGMFDDEHCKKELNKYDSNYEETIKNFIDELDNYYSYQPFTLWKVKENKFKNESPLFHKICKILAITEHYSYEKRASTLKNGHPLSIQVDLSSGVANGVLVVRSHQQCADLLYRILTNSMNFKIKHIGKEGGGVYILEEEISGCPFRVVTDYEKLTNSFWNFYLISD